MAENYRDVREYRSSTENSLIVDYLLWSFSFNFLLAEIGKEISISFMRIPGRPEFMFKVEKCSPDTLNIVIEVVYAHQNEHIDAGVELQFDVVLLGYYKDLNMFINQQTSTASCLIRYNDIDISYRESNVWDVKSTIKVNEMNNLNNFNRFQQLKLVDQLSLSEKCISDLCFLVNKDSVNDLFSGRQEFEYAFLKFKLIERTAVFAEELANKKRAREKGEICQNVSSQNIYLNFIQKGVFCEIDKHELLKLYIKSYHFSLPFLAEECKECMLKHVNDNDYLLSMLMCADSTKDEPFTAVLADNFIARWIEITSSDTWQNLLERDCLLLRNFRDIALRRIHTVLHHINQSIVEIELQEDQNRSSRI